MWISKHVKYPHFYESSDVHGLFSQQSTTAGATVLPPVYVHEYIHRSGKWSVNHNVYWCDHTGVGSYLWSHNVSYAHYLLT